MKRVIRLGVLTGALLGLVGTMTPAHATTTADATFTGTATTTPIGYPCTPAGTTTNCPPPVGTTPNFGFAFGSTTCAGTKTDVAKPGKPTRTWGPGCSINAAGTGTGYCGSSTATGTATITYTAPPPLPPSGTKAITINFTWTSAGGTIIATGTGQKTPGGTAGTMAATVEAIPTPGTGSCADKAATNFTIIGQATYAEPTN